MEKFDDFLLQLLDETETCLLSAQCRILEGQIMRDAFEKDLLQFLPHRFDFGSEGHMSNTFDYYVLPCKGEELLVLEAEEYEFFMKMINWKQMLPTQILHKDSYNKNVHSKDVLIEFMNNNQVSIERFEIQCERLFEQVVDFEKLEIGDNKFIIVEKKDAGKLKNIEDDLVCKEIDEVLDVIYALFINVHLKRIWKQHHLLLKFKEFLPNRRNNKDDVFFVSYMPP